VKKYENQLKLRGLKKLKEDIYCAQRMYYLCQKYDKRIPASIKFFCMKTLNNYIKIAKDVELQLSREELYDRLFDK